MTETNPYAEAVAQAATALRQGDEANWELARLTHAHTYDRGRPSTQDGKVSMKQWCADVRASSGRRFSEGTGRIYRRVWEQHGRHVHNDLPSWIEAYEQAGGLTRPLPTPEPVPAPPPAPAPPRRRTKAQAAEVLAKQTVGPLDTLPTEEKVALFDQLLADPAVTTEVNRQGREQRERRARSKQEAIRTDPIVRKFDELDALLSLQKLVSRFIKDAAGVLPRIDADHYRRLAANGDKFYSIYFFRSQIATFRTILERIEGWLSTGEMGGDVDAFFKRVLAESRNEEGGTEHAA